MTISFDVVEHVARLAHVGLERNEVAELSAELSSVLAHVAKLQDVDTAEILPTSHVLPLQNVLREDEVTPSWSVDQVLANAPRHSGSFFEVQAVFD